MRTMNAKKIAIIVVGISLLGIFTGFMYARSIFSGTSGVIFETIKDEDWRVEDYVFFPPSMTLVLVYSINNPTNNSLEVEMDLDFYAGDYHLSKVNDTMQLDPGNTTTFEIELAYDSEILEKIYGGDEAYGSFIIDGWFKVKGNVLIFPVESSITFENEDVISVLPAFDALFDSG